jgi:hypothetical protein
LEKIKHGFKTLAECGGIRGVDDTSSLYYVNLFVCPKKGTSRLEHFAFSRWSI